MENLNDLARATQILLNDIDPGAKVNRSAQFGGLRPVLDRREAEVYSENCYICRDPSYAAYGLPLCYCCTFCGGHIAADDSVCDDCGRFAQ